MKRIVATGTFDILHPGHIYYLEKSRELGDELYVIVARDVNVKHKPAPVVPEEQRLCMMQSLAVVDHACLGDTEDMFRPIEEIDPAIITLGFNQHFSEDSLRKSLRSRGIDAEVVRIGAYDGPGYAGSRLIMQRILETRCPDGGKETDNTDRGGDEYMADTENTEISESAEQTKYDTVTCRHCDGAGCIYCNKTGSVEVKAPAKLCPACGGDCCIYCGYTGWERPRGKYD